MTQTAEQTWKHWNYRQRAQFIDSNEQQFKNIIKKHKWGKSIVWAGESRTCDYKELPRAVKLVLRQKLTGKLNAMKKTFTGKLQGPSHAQGGVNFKMQGTDKIYNLEGGEYVVNKKSMASEKKHIFDGKKKTNEQIVEKINDEQYYMQRGGRILSAGNIYLDVIFGLFSHVQMARGGKTANAEMRAKQAALKDIALADDDKVAGILEIEESDVDREHRQQAVEERADDYLDSWKRQGYLKRGGGVWTDKQTKAVAKLDAEFDKAVLQKGIKPNSKQASNFWREGGYKKRMVKIFS